MTWAELTTLLMSGVALITVLVQWYNGRTARQGTDASAAKDISEAYSILVGPLEKRVKDLEDQLIIANARANRLEKELEAMKAREEEYLAGIRVLISQIVSIGEKPLWKPKDSIG